MELDLGQLNPTQKYFLLSSLIVPRPIAWLTTLNEDGSVNAAPFSYFQIMGENPPLIVLGLARRADGSPKDTFRNLHRQREFVLNLVTEANSAQMSLSATDFPPEISEPTALHLETTPSVVVKPPRLKCAPGHLEGRHRETLLIGENQVVMGELLHVHLNDEFIDAQTLRVHTEKIGLIGRLQGGNSGGYARTTAPFQVPRLSYTEWQAQQ